MITKLFNHARTLWQKPDGEYEIPEPAISGNADAIGLIVLEQDGNTIKPCHCGYAGDLHATLDGVFLTLQCPACTRSVEAFTLRGLVNAWNVDKQPEAPARGGSV